MGRYIVFCLIMGMFTLSMAQKPVINLKFSAEYAGSYLELDSIVIKNLTQGGDTVLMYPDTTLKLEYNTDIAETMLEKDGFYVHPNSPNPFAGQTSFDVAANRGGQLSVGISDVYGRNICFFERLISPGLHRFDFFPGKDKLYFANVNFENSVQCIKMLSDGLSGSNAIKLEYKGFTKQGEYKSTTAKSGFKYAFGNQLQYLGYARSPQFVPGMDMITDIPIGNADIVFEIFEGLPCPGTPFLFYGARYYSTVQIGNQCWMKENMAYNINNSFCYENSTSNCEKYGRLYKWTAASIVCPDGWHLPDNDEWNELFDLLGGMGFAAGKMKVHGTVYWDPPNSPSTNESGFSALPAGLRMYDGSYNTMYSHTYFWSSTEYDASRAWEVALYAVSIGATMSHNTKEWGISVRCVKDE
ncbi:MAG: fibrobacter succinogenes major paralogous domain-containing protein [Bacteroidales bacterium]|nr:fibrobacter succinogenes major paralogous domain-containing protein [Bacteroidales bacterium]